MNQRQKDYFSKFVSGSHNQNNNPKVNPLLPPMGCSSKTKQVKSTLPAKVLQANIQMKAQKVPLPKPSEKEDEDSGNHSLGSETRPENPGSNEEQRNIHADGVETDFPRPHGVEDVGETVCAAGGQQIGVYKHYVTYGKKKTA